MFSKPISSMQNDESIVDKILKSNLQIAVTSIDTLEVLGINEIIHAAIKSGKAIVFTVTPGPFKSAAELPPDWMQTPAAVGCTAQLTAFEKSFDELNAVVFAVNKQTSAYQQSLLAVKGLKNLLMISDATNTLQAALNLATLTVNGKNYDERLSVVIKSNENGKLTGKLFEIASPVNDVKAAEHITAIKNFIAPQLAKVDEYKKSAVAM
jgi:peroxiredoxin